MKTVAIIQARMTSTRLPGKALIEINGKPILEYVVDRVRQAKHIDYIVVATSTDQTDDPIDDWCEAKSVHLFRGSLTDVLDRYYQCATLWSADIIVRVTADCPLLDPELLDALVTALKRQGTHYAYTTGWPEGIGQEAFTSEALEWAWKLSTHPYDREHVVPWIIRHYNHAVIDNPRVTLDTPEDLERISPLLT